MSMQIENQGHHDGEGFKEIALDLWDNKPLLIGLAAVLFVVVYLLAKNRAGVITAPGQTTPTNPTPTAASGNYLIVNDVTPPNVAVTVNGTTSGTTATPPPPTPGPPPKPILNPGPPVRLPGPIRPIPAQRTVHPQPWPGAQSTLSGIASANGISLGQLENLNQWIFQQRGTWNLIYPSDNIRVA